MNNPNKYDIAVIGSGIACTSSLRQLLERLQKMEKPAVPLRIAIIEKDREFWTGLPYGCRSSVNSLTITTLGEFIHPEDKAAFVAWLEKERADWMEQVRLNGDGPASVWTRNNEGPIARHQWDELYVPRFLYGNYLKEKIAAAIEATGRLGMAKVDLITAEAIDLIAAENGDPQGAYTIVLEYKGAGAHDPHGHGAVRTDRIRSQKVLLAVGSPPVKPIPAPRTGQVAYLSINDTYAPGLEENLRAIGAALSAIPEREKRNLLVVGSNASSLELLYMIRHRPELKELVHRICVLSYSGLLPHRITPAEHPDYRFEHLLALKARNAKGSKANANETRMDANGQDRKDTKGFDADELITTIEKDVALAYAKGVHIGDTYYQLSDLVVELQGLLDWDQQKRFSNMHGMRFTRLIRRAGAEYRDAAEDLARDGQLVMIRGKFLELVAAGDQPDHGDHAVQADETVQAVQARFISLPDQQTQIHPVAFTGVLNCGGFEDLPHSSSRIIANLVARKICRINSTERGFEVNEKLEAAPNLFINGPLLGGIFNKQLRLWHVENAKRIHTLSLLLAEPLMPNA